MKKQVEVSLLANMPIYIANKFLYTQIARGLQGLIPYGLKMAGIS